MARIISRSSVRGAEYESVRRFVLREINCAMRSDVNATKLARESEDRQYTV